MNESIQKAAARMYVLAIAGALIFGITQVPLAADWPECDTASNGEIGACPPFTEQTCQNTCFNMFGTFGSCQPTDCCVCAI